MTDCSKLGFLLYGISATGRWLAVFVVAAIWFASPSCADQTESGSNKHQYRQQALKSIPYQRLNRPTIEKISSVLQNPSIYRRLPITTIQADPDYLRFLVRHPEVVVNVWQLMGITQMATDRTGPFTIHSDDGAGTISSLELVYGNDRMHIFYGTGSYEGPILKKKLSGRCVLIMQTTYRQNSNGKTEATNRLDVFLKVENATLGLIAKTLQPIVGTTADHNFVESLKFVQRLQETTVNNGPGVQRMARRMDLDENVRNEFIQVAENVFKRAYHRPAMAPALVPTATRHVPRYSGRSTSTPDLGSNSYRYPVRSYNFRSPDYQQPTTTRTATRPNYSGMTYQRR